MLGRTRGKKVETHVQEFVRNVWDFMGTGDQEWEVMWNHVHQSNQDCESMLQE